MKKEISKIEYGDKHADFKNSDKALSENAVDLLNIIRDGKEFHVDMFEAPVPTPLTTYELFGQMQASIEKLEAKVRDLEAANDEGDLSNLGGGPSELDEVRDDVTALEAKDDFNTLDDMNKSQSDVLKQLMHCPASMGDIATSSVSTLLDHLLENRAALPTACVTELPETISDPPTQAEVEALSAAIAEIQQVILVMSSK